MYSSDLLSFLSIVIFPAYFSILGNIYPRNVMIYKQNDALSCNYFPATKKLIAKCHPNAIENISSRLELLLGREWGYIGSIRIFIDVQYLSYASYISPVDTPSERSANARDLNS